MSSLFSYASPLGPILMTGEGNDLTGLWFVGQKHFPKALEAVERGEGLPVFDLASAWLDCYFSGKAPDFTVPVRLRGTPFQRQVWALLRAIPYGQCVTYGQLAGQLAQSRGLAQMSPRAVGSAVGRNPVSILVPCHRVIGADGSLTGYAGGVERKAALLRLEGILP